VVKLRPFRPNNDNHRGAQGPWAPPKSKVAKQLGPKVSRRLRLVLLGPYRSKVDYQWGPQGPWGRPKQTAAVQLGPYRPNADNQSGDEGCGAAWAVKPEVDNHR